MNNINIFCFGFGQVAKSFISKLNSENFKINLSTTTRQPTQNLKINNINYSNFQLDNKNFDKKLLENLKHAEHILISIPPIGGIDLIAKNFCDVLEKSNLKWVTYLSATSVYGDHNGDWVDENSETKPTSSNGIERLKVEKEWMQLASKFDLPFQIFRLSGIYSNQYNILKRLKSGEAKIINKKNHFFSRIHVEDVANILSSSIVKAV